MKDVLIQPPFVDQSRILLVDGLLSIFDDMIKHQESRWVSLEAPSGWGKTRVVQELYVRLAARQKHPYWPATIIEASDAEHLDVASRRKRIFSKPNYCKPDIKNFPEFMWWGIACDLRNGVPSQVLLEDLEQITTHSMYLTAARFTLKSIKDKKISSIASANKILNTLVDEVAGLTLSESLQLLADIVPVVGIGSTVKLARWGIDKLKESNELKAKMKIGNLFSDEEKKEDLIQLAMDLVGKITRAGIPTIVFIEDYHKATPIMEELVERMIRTDAKLFIITTTWPKEIESKKRMSMLMKEENLKSRILRVRHDVDAPAVFPKGASINELSEKALEEIILSYYPKADKKTLKFLAARYNNPLPLELVCTLKKYQDAFRDGALKLTEKEVEALPKRVENLYRELWNELPEIIQNALTLSTLAIPDNEASWHSNLLQRSLERSTSIKDYEALAQSFARDRIPHGWVRTIEKWLRRFSEPDQLAVAQGYVGDYFFEKDIQYYLKQLAEELKYKEFNWDTQIESQYYARLVLSLHKKGFISDIYALKAILFLQQVLKNYPLEIDECIRLGKYLNNLDVGRNSIEMLAGISNYATALLDSGQTELALSEAKSLPRDLSNILGPEHIDTLTARSNLIKIIASMGKVDNALNDSEALLKDLVRLFGLDHPQTMVTRNNYALWLSQSGRLKDAHKEYTALIQDQIRTFGSSHPQTLITRGNFACLLQESGRLKDAQKEYETLLQDYICIHGSDHQHTLEIRQNIAVCLGSSGQLKSALREIELLLSDMIPLLGQDHPSVLTVCGNRGDILMRLGQLHDAEEEFTSLLKRKKRLLGPDHPSTLSTRNNVTSCLAQLGQTELALEGFNSLLVDRIRILGPDHPDTLITRNNIAHVYSKSGLIDLALNEFESLLQDQTHILNPEHPSILGSRYSIAECLLLTGQAEVALTKSNSLLKDQIRILGQDHPDILTTRDLIVYCLVSMGSYEKALTELYPLLKDHIRIFGQDHPKTLSTRFSIALG